MIFHFKKQEKVKSEILIYQRNKTWRQSFVDRDPSILVQKFMKQMKKFFFAQLSERRENPWENAVT